MQPKPLGAHECVLLFCLASGTDWNEAGVTLKTVAGMVGKGFVFSPNALFMLRGDLTLTDAGRAVLRTLLRDL